MAPLGAWIGPLQLSSAEGVEFAPKGIEHWKQGFYREVVEPERLVFTFAWEDAEGKPGHETVVTVTFAEHGTKAKLTSIRAY